MRAKLRPVPLTQVKVTDEFWGTRQRQVVEIAVPYMERVLRDDVPGAARSHAIENFRIAAGLSSGKFYGMVFHDSDVAK